jgi:hypothetical protein
MNLSTFILGALIATLYGAVFHLLRGGGLAAVPVPGVARLLGRAFHRRPVRLDLPFLGLDPSRPGNHHGAGPAPARGVDQPAGESRINIKKPPAFGRGFSL